jgi:hypothetical protein
MKVQMQTNENEKQDLLKQISELKEALKNTAKPLNTSFSDLADV